MRRRLNVLRQLPMSKLKIFGGKDWSQLGEPLASCYAGQGLDYGPDLAWMYFHSQININVFHEQCHDSTNSRVYDVLASGGFLLTEDRPCLRREFEPDRHLVTFSTPEEAREKALYYLTHVDEREAIAREGQRHVLANHTFSKRCERILELVRPYTKLERHRDDDVDPVWRHDPL